MGYGIPLDIEVVGSSVQWGRRFKWPDDYFRGYWVLNISSKTYAGSQSDIDTYAGGLEKTRGNGITQVISRDSRDRQEFTSRGSRFTWETTVSGGPLKGNEDFLKHVLNLEWYTPTFWKFVLMSSLKLGVVRMLPSYNDEESIIPFDERFIMGGNGLMYGNPLRGYEDNRVGPLTSRGSPVGGNALAKVSTEFRVPFSENPVVYGLLFAENGTRNSVDTFASALPPTGLPLDVNGPTRLSSYPRNGLPYIKPLPPMINRSSNGMIDSSSL
jgi:outer membrane protein insertion porin family